MKKFYNRKDEIQALLDIHKESKDQARFTYIIGQRRIGKTKLIEHVFLNSKFQKKNKVVYFFVERKSVDALLLEFTDLLKSIFDLTPEFKDLSSFFKYLFEQSRHQNLTIIFDEFQNFSYVDSSVFSTLQKLWDKHKYESYLNLITIGSIYSSMEKIFVSKHEPLFGRPTDKLSLKTFSISTLQEILKDNKVNSFDQLLSNFTLFNGIPKYWDILEYKKLLNKKPDEILLDLFLSSRSLLKNEGKELLMEEFGPEYHTYFSIIEAIATLSKVSTNKIASRVGIESHHVSTYLASLNKKFSLITKKKSLINFSNKKGRYILNNRFLQTWFRYIFANKSLVESGNKQEIINKFNKDFQSYKGLAFEDLTIQILKSTYQKFSYETWGGYWDKQREIDIVGINKSEKTAMIGECKLSVNMVNDEIVQKMEENARYLSSVLVGYKVKKYIFVASKGSKSKAKQWDDDYGIKLVDKDELLGLITESTRNECCE
ncbi:ATP-binding protein [Patescibacteria group bacterium]|nr:ATP-binding protein [Patescibacteria group bacterium]